MISTASTATPSLPLLASLQTNASIADAVSYQLAGFAVVLLSLSALWALCEIVSLWFKRAGTATAAGASVRKGSTEGPKTAPVQSADSAMTAVIAAAVYATLGRRAVIRQISPPLTTFSDPQLAAWTLQGRLQHHTSHSPR